MGFFNPLPHLCKHLYSAKNDKTRTKQTNKQKNHHPKPPPDQFSRYFIYFLLSAVPEKCQKIIFPPRKPSVLPNIVMNKCWETENKFLSVESAVPILVPGEKNESDLSWISSTDDSSGQPQPYPNPSPSPGRRCVCARIPAATGFVNN